MNLSWKSFDSYYAMRRDLYSDVHPASCGITLPVGDLMYPVLKFVEGQSRILDYEGTISRYMRCRDVGVNATLDKFLNAPVRVHYVDINRWNYDAGWYLLTDEGKDSWILKRMSVS